MNRVLLTSVLPIRRYCDAEQIEFIGIDSVGLACNGKLIDDDVAIRFHRALSSLPLRCARLTFQRAPLMWMRSRSRRRSARCTSPICVAPRSSHYWATA